jgi:pimeloyl-ACP methyl ester carboxylesterase
VHVAAERAVEGVILSAPYARLCSLFTRRLGVPACHLPRFERWASVERAPDVAEPVLILHGSADAVVPLSQGLTLAQALPEAQTVIIEGANHLDLVDYSEYLTAIDRFIAARQH